MTRLRLDATLVEVVIAFDAHGVDALLLKGAAFARWLYDDPGERTYGDIDLMVGPATWEQAQEALTELGFAAPLREAFEHERVSHHELWCREEPRVVIELHSSLYLLPGASVDSLWRTFTAGSQTLQVAGVAIPVPAPDVSTLLVALHAAQHGHAARQSVTDLRRALERVDVETWRRAAKLATDLDASAVFAFGLRLVPEGRDLATALGLSAEPTTRHARLCLSSPPPTTFGIEELVAAGGWRARLQMLRHKIFPSAAFMRAWYPPPFEGPPGRVAAHVGRWLLLARGLPGGLRFWLRTARASDRAAG